MIDRNISDAKLIALVQREDEQAFELLYERYVKLVYYIAFRFCANEADTQDVVQETFLQIKRTIRDLKNPDMFKYWLNKITISKCKNLFRKNKYMTYDCEHYEAKSNLLETREDVQPDCRLKFDSDKAMLNHFINELPKGQREVVILHYLEQFSVEETAALLEIPQGTVKSRLSYARTMLKTKIEKYEKDHHVELNFHSLDGAIAAALVSSFQGLNVPGNLAVIYQSMHPSHFFQMAIGKVALGVTLCVGSGMVYAVAMNQHSFNQGVQEQAGEEINTFPATDIRATSITSARSAYYTIKTWACCEEEMEMLETTQLKDVYRLYQVMKTHGSIYYQSLEEEGWCQALETIYRNKVQ